MPIKFLDEANGTVIGGADWAKELYVVGDSSSGYRRLDLYSPDGSIISLKHSQYGSDSAAIQRAKAAIDELVAKYPPGTKIADVPSTPSKMVGEDLLGQPILGVPIQNDPISPAVLDHAKEMGVRIAEIDIPSLSAGI